MSSLRFGIEGEKDKENDLRVLDIGEEYEKNVVAGFKKSPLVSSLVCYGALPTEMDLDAEPDETIVGRGLAKSYMISAFNAACTAYPEGIRGIEHCMFRTTGDFGYVMDNEDRVWQNDSVGAFVTLMVSAKARNYILDASNQIFTEVENAGPVHRAVVDQLFLPFVMASRDEDPEAISCETLVYIHLSMPYIFGNITHDDVKIVRDGLRNVKSSDSLLARQIFGVISAQFGMVVPTYIPSGPAEKEAKLIRETDWDDTDLLACRLLKHWIEMVNDIKRCGLLCAAFLDSFYLWGGEDDELDAFAEFLEEHPKLPHPLNIYDIADHRSITRDLVCGVPSTSENFEINGGVVKPAEHGEITTKYFSGRITGTVDQRRVVAFFKDGDVVVQFKDARNYFFNVAHFIRPGIFVKTEVRDEVIDRNKLTGIPALHLLLRGNVNKRLAMFTIASLTFEGISMRTRKCNSGIGAVLGKRDGFYLQGMAWYTWREDMTLPPVEFGNLSTPYPLRDGRPRRLKRNASTVQTDGASSSHA